MLTEAYRGQVDYFVQGGVSVSQLSSSVRSDRSGQPDGEMVDRSGQPDECNSSKAQIRTLLEEQRQDQNTILELSGRIQELQNEVNCMNDSKDFQDAESIRSGNSHVTCRPVSFPPHPIPEGMLRHSFVSPSRREGPPSIWDTHGISGNVFADPVASSSAPYPQELHL